jgi:hypothetical protein
MIAQSIPDFIRTLSVLSGIEADCAWVVVCISVKLLQNL